jgi:hypothetical protein
MLSESNENPNKINVTSDIYFNSTDQLSTQQNQPYLWYMYWYLLQFNWSTEYPTKSTLPLIHVLVFTSIQLINWVPNKINLIPCTCCITSIQLINWVPNKIDLIPCITSIQLINWAPLFLEYTPIQLIN